MEKTHEFPDLGLTIHLQRISHRNTRVKVNGKFAEDYDSDGSREIKTFRHNGKEYMLKLDDGGVFDPKDFSSFDHQSTHEFFLYQTIDAEDRPFFAEIVCGLPAKEGEEDFGFIIQERRTFSKEKTFAKEHAEQVKELRDKYSLSDMWVTLGELSSSAHNVAIDEDGNWFIYDFGYKKWGA